MLGMLNFLLSLYIICGIFWYLFPLGSGWGTDEISLDAKCSVNEVGGEPAGVLG
jgi:hypothetical protein